MDNSPLGKLPPELRNHIYQYVMLSADGIIINKNDKGAVSLDNVDLALTTLCRQSRLETEGLIQTNTVTITLDLLDGWRGAVEKFEAYQVKELMELERWARKAGAMGLLATAPKVVVDLGCGEYLHAQGSNFAGCWSEIIHHRFGLLGQDSLLLPRVRNLEVRMRLELGDAFTLQYCFPYGTDDRDATRQAVEKCFKAAERAVAAAYGTWAYEKLFQAALISMHKTLAVTILSRDKRRDL
jgi:hypothetical protein